MSEAGLNVPVEPSSEFAENKAVLSIVQTAGGQLAAARVQQGLSVQQVADQLKLSQRQVVALENNNFEDLPKMVIVRGFVRSYAKLLKLDAAPIVDSLPGDAGVSGLEADLRPTLATPFMESRTPFLGRQDSNNRKYLIGATLLAIFALGFVAVQKLEKSDYFKNILSAQSVKKAPDTVLDKQAENAEQTASKPAGDATADRNNAVAPVVNASGSANTTANPTAANTTASTVAETAPAVPTVLSTMNDTKPEAHAQSQTQAQPASQAKANTDVAVAPAIASQPSTSTPLVVAAAPAADAANNQLRLKFRQDSWIQVKRENGTVLTSHLARAGTEEVFDMKEGLQLRIGNAAGVDGWLRGKSMGIAPGKDSNVLNMNVK